MARQVQTAAMEAQIIHGHKRGGGRADPLPFLLLRQCTGVEALTTKRLVAVSLAGNLGNQLFQWAAARSLQNDPNAPTVVDDRFKPVLLGGVLRPGTFRRITQRELLTLRQAPKVSVGQPLVAGLRSRPARLFHINAHRKYEHDQAGGPFTPNLEGLRTTNEPVILRGY